MTLKKYILFFFGNTFTEGEMNMDFKNSQTKDNLMRAFAGESQARNRYQFAANQAKSVHQYVLAELFEFTAKQEEAHAKVFYDHLMELSGETISIDGFRGKLGKNPLYLPGKPLGKYNGGKQNV